MLTQNGEAFREVLMPQIIVLGVRFHIRLGSRVPSDLGVDVQQALVGHQVDVVVVVESHGRLLVVAEVREVHGLPSRFLLRTPVLEHVGEHGVHLRIHGGVDPLLEGHTVCSSNCVSSWN